MGFFSELKEDLSQAVNELVPKEEQGKTAEPAVKEQTVPAEQTKEEGFGANGLSLKEMLEKLEYIENAQMSEEPLPETESAAEELNMQDVPESAEISEREEAIQETEIPADSPESEEAPWEPEEPEEVPQEPEEVPEEPEEVPQEPKEVPEEPEEVPQEPEEAPQEPEEVPEEPEEAPQEPEEAPQKLVPPEGLETASLLEQVLEENPPEESREEKQSKMQDADPENNDGSKGAEKTMDINTERERVAVDETSVITEGMSITGDIVSEGSIEVIGTVNGNIDALGKLNITGHINGNSKAAEIYAESAKINGEISSEGTVKIGASTVVIGNITATSAVVAGAVKGDIDVHGPVVLDTSAIVMGNIKSKSVQINNGAVVEGMCSQCYADVSPASFFEEYKPEVPEAKTSK